MSRREERDTEAFRTLARLCFVTSAFLMALPLFVVPMCAWSGRIYSVVAAGLPCHPTAWVLVGAGTFGLVATQALLFARAAKLRLWLLGALGLGALVALVAVTLYPGVCLDPFLPCRSGTRPWVLGMAAAQLAFVGYGAWRLLAVPKASS